MPALNNKMMLNTEQLAEVFYSGCKTQEAAGVESEKLLVYKDSLKAVKYEDIVKVLDSFDKAAWTRVYEDNSLIGLKGEAGSITLEPGSQIEISLKPFEKLEDIAENLMQFYSDLAVYAEKIGARVLDSGIQPVSTYENIKIIPKKRYEFMTKYLPLRGSEPFIMMRETAGIQANFDYKSEEDAVFKLSLALKMSPVISAVYSNSPVRAGKLTGLKSNRAASWLKVDEERCGYISRKLFDAPESFTFKDYTEILLDVPMIFIYRNGQYFGTVQTFREFMQKGFLGMHPQMSDWENHLSLYFPDVRLKSYIEIRNHDAQNVLMTLSVPAFWKGVMYNNDAALEIKSILKKFEYEDFINLRRISPIEGISAKLGRYCIIDLIKEFFDISYASLKENGAQEEKYLEPVYEYIALKRTPADDVIDKFSKLQPGCF